MKHTIDIDTLRDELNRAVADGADSVDIYRDDRGEVVVEWDGDDATDDPDEPEDGWLKPDPEIARAFERRHR